MDEIKCPYCGREETDSWERNMSDGDVEYIECGNCYDTFRTTCEIQVSYHSESLERGECVSCGDEKRIKPPSYGLLGLFEGYCVECYDKTFHARLQKYGERFLG